MATSSVGTSTTTGTTTSSAAKTSTQASVAASNRANAQKIMSSLSAGSGVDTASLAQNLVDAERVPRENAINAKISKNDSKITGLSAIMFMMSELKTKMAALKDKSSFNSLTVNNSQSSAFSVSTNTSAAVGSHDIRIDSIAKAKRIITPNAMAFTSPTAALNAPFDLTLSSDNPGIVTGSTIGPAAGAVSGTSSGATIQGVQVGSTGAPFTGLTLTAGGQQIAVNLQSVGGINSLDDLKAAIEGQLTAAGVTDISLSVSGDAITFASATRAVTQAGLSTVSTGAVSFGATPSLSDFKSFKITVDGVAREIVPAPGTTTLKSLAENIQSQLQKLDERDDLQVRDVNGTLQVFSNSGRSLSGLSVSNQMSIQMAPAGANSGTPVDSVGANPARLDGVSFGTLASVNDFKGFSITINGTPQTLIPAPATATLTDLAANLQSQIRTLDGSSDITVSVVNGSLYFASASQRSLTMPILLKNSFAQTPEGVVAAINSKNAGVKAELVNTGNALKPYKILVTGATGVTQDFTLSSATPEVNFSAIAGYERATDAVFSVNGIAMTRNSNVVTDAIAGVTINLRSATSGAAVLDLARDTASLKTKMTDLVTAYNDASDLLNQVSDPKSTLDTYGATLVGDSTVRMVRQQLRSIIQGTSSTPGNSVSALWQLGFSLDEKGVMSLDSTKLDTALQSNFNDVVKSLTGNQENLSAYSNAPAGLMGDAVRKITGLLDKSGPLMSQSESASTQNTKYQKDLTDLQTRMDALLARYTKQFAAMDTLVGQINTQKTSLKSTFDGMMAAYTNK
jgi:flagellar capping protein FliD